MGHMDLNCSELAPGPKGIPAMCAWVSTKQHSGEEGRWALLPQAQRPGSSEGAAGPQFQGLVDAQGVRRVPTCCLFSLPPWEYSGVGGAAVRRGRMGAPCP